jgi:hypothetical protein
MTTISCPRCQKETEVLMEVPSELQLKLMDISLSESLHSQVCGDCLRTLKGAIGNPSQFKQKQNVDEAHKQALWSSRADLIKRARASSDENHWAHASKNYEAYIQVLETIFEQKPGQLTPDVFRAMAKIEEMKTLILVYWELILIHDGRNEKLVDTYSEKLAIFGKCSPLKMSLLDKIKDYEPKSVFKKYIRRTDRELRGEKGLFSIFKAS